MKGIVLAGGSGTRLWPITKSTSKQLLPVYDKPLIYYPIATLMLSGIREILIITTPHQLGDFQRLLGDGSSLGVKFVFKVQTTPRGLVEALTIGEEFIGSQPVTLILGDNVFYGSGITDILKSSFTSNGCTIFTYQVANPQDYGVIVMDSHGFPIEVSEKPSNPNSNLAVTGLYVFDERAVEIANQVKPSPRGELEIISVINDYLEKRELTVKNLSRGMAWLDTGTPEALNDAATFVRVIEERTGQKIACLEEIAWRNGWLSSEELISIASKFKGSRYGSYLSSLTISSEQFEC
jgi:glucose-1-phosphate thymidylyltransferase